MDSHREEKLLEQIIAKLISENPGIMVWGTITRLAQYDYRAILVDDEGKVILSGGDLVEKDLADILADEVAFKGADIPSILSKTGTTLSKTDTILSRVPSTVTQRGLSNFKKIEKKFADSVRIEVKSTAQTQTIATGFLVDIPADVTVRYAHILVFSQATENTNSSENKVKGAQYLQVQKLIGGTWTTCGSIKDDALRVPAQTRDMGRLLAEPADCSGQINESGLYELRWVNSQVDYDSMYFHDVFFLVEVGFY